ncbi:hypothetical protein [Mesorhizobium sp.]|uniref:hypothetical protein n=1 Tax=Mesorhizobium sp. TaxID=1871066 RepID=UPI000FE9E50F|nr:hypothetical protein [Mesorhizobium sp.]RWC28423.1 MAG: hypothetical protein EOS27_18875 [Mesorhizobium sp.]TIX23192.1 MAG: hypothetical protein E5V35_23120 [Mesorhizobium sp.]
MSQPGNPVSAFDCDILRSAFIKCVIEKKIPEDKWRAEAALLIRDYMDTDDIEPGLLEWIVRK